MGSLTTEKLAQRMLVCLVRWYDANPEQRDIGISDNDWHVRFVIREKLVETDSVYSMTRGAVRYLKEKQWVTGDGYSSPTAAGLERVRLLMRPWWRKVVDYVKGDVRTVVVAVITTIVALLLAKLVERLFA